GYDLSVIEIEIAPEDWPDSYAEMKARLDEDCKRYDSCGGQTKTGQMGKAADSQPSNQAGRKDEARPGTNAGAERIRGPKQGRLFKRRIQEVEWQRPNSLTIPTERS